MNEFYLLKKSTPPTQYQIETEIYQDIYQYRDSDNITLKMLQSIILNQNKYVLIQVLSKKKLTQFECLHLLETICKEGDEYIDFFHILYAKINLTEQIILSLVEKAIISNGVKILQILFSDHIDIIQNHLTESFFKNAIEKNDNKDLIEILIKYVDKVLIFTVDLLQDIINNDNLELFKCYVNNQSYNDYNTYLDSAIEKNAYDIIDYILSENFTYVIQQKSYYYNDFFDYLISENIDKTICFLNKADNIYLLGHNNLEKLLLAFDNYEDFEFLLFNYNLMNLEFINEVLKQKIKKFLLNKKLKEKLIFKNNKEIKKI